MSGLKKSIGDLRRKVYRVFKWLKMKFSPSLVDVGLYYGTDKTNEWHTFKGGNYLDVYEKYFASMRKQKFNLLEIGVRDGQSVKMWQEYFPKAMIHGLDIDPKCQEYESKNISITIGSQDDKMLIDSLCENTGKFKIIIDDGSHVNELTLASFFILFEKLESGGIYIVEDLGCSYIDLSLAIKDWPGMQHNKSSVNYNNNRSDMDLFFLEKIKDMDHLRGEIRSIQFWPLMCVIIKA